MRSCSSPVFMEEPAKPISPLYAAALVLVGERQTGGRGWWVQLQRPMRPMGVAGSARGRGARRSMSPFPGTALRTRRASHPGTGLSTRPATNNGCVAARLRSTRPGLPARRRYSPAAPALPTRHRSLAVPFAMCTPLACSDSYGHSARPATTSRRRACPLPNGRGGRRRVASHHHHHHHHPVDEVGASSTRQPRQGTPQPFPLASPTGHYKPAAESPATAAGVHC